jgi:hypothetical protein
MAAVPRPSGELLLDEHHERLRQHAVILHRLGRRLGLRPFAGRGRGACGCRYHDEIAGSYRCTGAHENASTRMPSGSNAKKA